jgi:hypothetical protein
MPEQLRASLEAIAAMHRRIAEQAEHVRAPLAALPSEPLDAEAMADYEVEMRAVAHERALRRVAGTKGDPGRPGKGMSRETFWKIVELGLERALSGRNQPTLEAISNATRRPDLTSVSRKRLTPIVEWVAANPKRARRALERGEIPALFRPAVAD